MVIPENPIKLRASILEVAINPFSFRYEDSINIRYNSENPKD